MTPLLIGQFMAAAIFLTVGLFHTFIWAQRPGSKVHLLFSLTAIGSGANAIAEAYFFRATTIDAFNVAFKWSNSLNALLYVALVWFVVAYTGSSKRWLAAAISCVFLPAALANALMPYGFLYTEITGLRSLILPWGETIALVEGVTNPWRILTDMAFIAVIVLVLDGALRLRSQGGRPRALLLCGALTLYMAMVLVFGLLVDLGVVSLPYLFTYGFLAVVLAMSYDLAGEVVRVAALSAEVKENERRWRALLENVRLLVCGVDREGYVNYINPFFAETSGFTLDEVVGRCFTDFLPAGMREERKKVFDQAIEGRLRPQVESRLQTKQGNERNVMWSEVLLRDREGRITGMLGIGADITDQRKAEASRDKALGKTEDALREVEALKNRLEEEVVYLREEVFHFGDFEEIIGQSDALKYVLARVEQVAPLDTTVLIEGETGVGKELFARAIHAHGARCTRPLVKVNCAALPASLIETELFGHERGAFTGATRTRRGRFELADGGTVFLDEVAELPVELQGKILRVLQEGEVERIGGERSIRVDVRVIAATNRKLAEEVKQGNFREDLFYRLHVYPITVPSLRQREGDIPLLVQAFVQRFSKEQGKKIDQIPQPVIDELTSYDWPGNVRELENVIEQAVIITSGKKLRLPARLKTQKERKTDPDEVYQGSLESVEREYILRILELTKWRIEGKKGAAELLGLHPNTLRFRMRKLDIRRPTVGTANGGRSADHSHSVE